jgi:hypothetical protein
MTVASTLTLMVVLATATTPAPPASGRQALEPLAFLAGSCWSGAFPDGKSTDTHCFEWVYGNFLRDRHVVRGAKTPYEGETLHAWDPRAGKPVFTYWASDGGYSTGDLEVRGSELVFREQYDSTRDALDIESVWKRAGDDAYSVETRRRRGDGWETMWTMTLRRTEG